MFNTYFTYCIFSFSLTVSSKAWVQQSSPLLLDLSLLCACAVSPHLCLFLSHPELNTGQIQEGVGEAINGIVKHFHKPEKEVRDSSLDRFQWILLLFIINEEFLLLVPHTRQPM